MTPHARCQTNEHAGDGRSMLSTTTRRSNAARRVRPSRRPSAGPRLHRVGLARFGTCVAGGGLGGLPGVAMAVLQAEGQRAPCGRDSADRRAASRCIMRQCGRRSSQSVGVRCVGRSGIWSGLMWSGSGAGSGLELSETFLNGPKWLRRDLRILCSSSSAHCVGPPWGSRGRRFKSCRPDGEVGSIPRSGP